MNGLVKTLIKPDWDDNPKRSEILHAANLLQIGEFQLIQLAYKIWYKKDLPEEKISKIFSEYNTMESVSSNLYHGGDVTGSQSRSNFTQHYFRR